MATRADNMIAALNAFEISEEDGNDEFRLHQITRGFDKVRDRQRIAPAMFALMERFPDADLGVPGPLVHAIESLGVAHYEPLLIESVRRQPTSLTVWMVNRILNSVLDSAHRSSLLSLMRSVPQHPRASEQVSAEARDFLTHHATGANE
jgi:hypothetical protein